MQANRPHRFPATFSPSYAMSRPLAVCCAAIVAVGAAGIPKPVVVLFILHFGRSPGRCLLDTLFLTGSRSETGGVLAVVSTALGVRSPTPNIPLCRENPGAEQLPKVAV